MAQDSPLLVAQITDTHLFAEEKQEMMGVLTAYSLRSVLKQLGRLQSELDVLLMTGDLSQDETPESYQLLRDWVTALGIPAYWLPGNHDRPSLMNQVLSSVSISTQKRFQLGEWNFILLNSMIPGQVHGELSAETLVWLEQQLQSSTDQPTLIALHHPPLLIDSAWMDRIGLQNPEALFAVIDRHPQVKLVVFGHIHQEFDQLRNEVRYLGSPSTCVQFESSSDKFAIGQQEPGFRLIYLYPDGSHNTYVERVAFRQLPQGI
ncbi:MAG: 3',5'-cyclic-AMP phosphodiesterase [Cyanobacteria bacterium CRU_2_1]|nr:3',5'-cyclic-AMP phosphodiesterase [Cyanobacteria bacterium CRU_2_1]